MKTILTSLFFMIIQANNSFGAGSKPNCDLMGDSIRNFKVADQLACESTCAKEDECQGAVFISGWNRCFLKKSIRKKVDVIMYSGLKNGPIKKNTDYSGKDFKQLDAGTPLDCKRNCENIPSCNGFTYIDGYRTCWIKSTKGKFRTKVFHCYEKL